MSFDLNLLRVLDALLAEESVTGAARKLGLSQSAVSHSLSRLRDHFDDPLFVRSPRGMVPTARAERMATSVQVALRAANTLLDDTEVFDPETTRRSFSIATTDMFGMAVLPALIGQLSAEAPGLDLSTRPTSDGPLEALESGSLDLAIGVFSNAPASLRRRKLYVDSFVSMVRKDHPTIGETMTLDQFCAVSHGLVAPNGRPGSIVDHALAEIGRSRRVALKVPSFLLAPIVAAQTDLLWTVPRTLSGMLGSYLPLRLVEPPIKLPTFSISQIWHERSQSDPAHAYLRQTLARLAQKIGDRP